MYYFYYTQKQSSSFSYFWLLLCFICFSPTNLFLGATNRQKTTFSLMGDSVLDNFHWLKNKKLDLRQQLENMGYTVKNYAVDASKVDHILYGKDPGSYANSRAQHKLPGYPVAKDGKVHPLDLFKEHHSNDPNVVVLLSVLGNNIVLEPHKSKEAAINRINTLRRKYENIVKEIKKANNKATIVLVIPYFLRMRDFFTTKWSHFNHGFNKEEFIEIYEVLFEIVSSVAAKHRCQIINLSMTFDPYDDQDYGSSPIEPSNRSSQYIADLGDALVKEKPTKSGQSYIYTGKRGNIQAVLNNQKARDNYPKRLKKLLKVEVSQTERSINNDDAIKNIEPGDDSPNKCYSTQHFVIAGIIISLVEAALFCAIHYLLQHKENPSTLTSPGAR